ncbi:hypothetical protein LSH36_9g13000 [Paralvinella palmiformis]|uniref:Uncharacterized protein n=1 Tax=Paralvinella palmiformis TaxID=53620 RepID=A0AAD9NIH1_9ANNE|nr:hypothetical protein LSH36_9g13000 [Paralvinella palmiformis]
MEDEEDGELRRSSYRHRSTSGTSRCSISSITSTHRPLTTSQQHSFSSSHSSMSYPYSTPSSPAPLAPEANVSTQAGSDRVEKINSSDQSSFIRQSHENYSPQVERKC